MHLEFSGEMWFWRGPSPSHFITVPDEKSAQLHAVSSVVTYGWGMIPVTARVKSTNWTTSLFPKNRGYLVPITAWPSMPDCHHLLKPAAIRG